jgi:hypothetical protein
MFLAESAARAGAASSPSASTTIAGQNASDRPRQSEDDSVSILIKLIIGMLPTNLSQKLDWPGCKAVMQLYHMRVFVLGKIDVMRGFFATPTGGMWKKVTRCVCTSCSAM